MITTKKLKSIRFQDLGNKGFPIETPPEQIRLHSVLLAVAKPRSGKTFFISNLLNMLPVDRILIASSTFDSNKKMMEHLKISEEDIFDPNDPDAVAKMIAVVEGERDDLVKYEEEMKRWKNFEKLLKKGERIPDSLLLEFYNGEDFKPPTHKWNGRKPTIIAFLDDAQNSKLMGTKLSNLVIKHRHIGAFKDGSRAIGLSLFIAIQNYCGIGNCLPKSIRSNATHLAVWKTGNKKELDLLSLEQSGMVEPEDFIKAYSYVFDNPNSSPHDFLFVDLAAKNGHSMFRRNYDEFIFIKTP
jgi:hypothetical protein